MTEIRLFTRPSTLETLKEREGKNMEEERYNECLKILGLVDAKFIIAYDENGDPLKVLAGRDCEETPIKEFVAEKGIKIDLLCCLKEHVDQQYFEIKSTQILRTYGSPGCYIISKTGQPICICCKKA
jgi:hypothetical protein